MSTLSGFLSVDKPVGISSFGVVAAARRAYGCRRAGHAGTLDPAASGLLVIALGNATRILPYLPLEPKRYVFVVQFGLTTDTLDSQGAVVKTGGTHPSRSVIETTVAKFRGPIQQVPPAYSAKKIGGQRAYRLAREGKPVELAARTVTIYDIRLTAFDGALGQATFDVSCSGGTYVRALARDIAEAAGTCGFTTSIRRMQTGAFSVDDALPLDALERREGTLIPVAEALRGLPFCRVDRNQTTRLRNGRRVSLDGVTSDGAPADVVFAFDAGNDLVAVLRRSEDGMYQPEKVFAGCNA